MLCTVLILSGRLSCNSVGREKIDRIELTEDCFVRTLMIEVRQVTLVLLGVKGEVLRLERRTERTSQRFSLCVETVGRETKDLSRSGWGCGLAELT